MSCNGNSPSPLANLSLPALPLHRNIRPCMTSSFCTLLDECCLVDCNSNTQEGCRNGRPILICAFILAIEQSLQILLQITGSAAPFGGFERIHRRPIISTERVKEH